MQHTVTPPTHAYGAPQGAWNPAAVVGAEPWVPAVAAGSAAPFAAAPLAPAFAPPATALHTVPAPLLPSGTPPRLVYLLWDLNAVPFPAIAAADVGRAMASVRALLLSRRIMESDTWPLRLHIFHSPGSGERVAADVIEELRRSEDAVVKAVSPSAGQVRMECAALYQGHIEVNRRVGMQIGAIVMATAAAPVIAVASMAHPVGLPVVLIRHDPVEEDTACAAVPSLRTIPMPLLPPAGVPAVATPVTPTVAPPLSATVGGGGAAGGMSAWGGIPPTAVGPIGTAVVAGGSVRTPSDARDCKHWLRGRCRRGDTCEFRHDPALLGSRRSRATGAPQTSQLQGVRIHSGGGIAAGPVSMGGNGGGDDWDSDDSDGVWDMAAAPQPTPLTSGGGQHKPHPDAGSGGGGGGGSWGGGGSGGGGGGRGGGGMSDDDGDPVAPTQWGSRV